MKSSLRFKLEAFLGWFPEAYTCYRQCFLNDIYDDVIGARWNDRLISWDWTHWTQDEIDERIWEVGWTFYHNYRRGFIRQMECKKHSPEDMAWGCYSLGVNDAKGLQNRMYGYFSIILMTEL